MTLKDKPVIYRIGLALIMPPLVVIIGFMAVIMIAIVGPIACLSIPEWLVLTDKKDDMEAFGMTENS